MKKGTIASLIQSKNIINVELAFQLATANQYQWTEELIHQACSVLIQTEKRTKIAFAFKECHKAGFKISEALFYRACGGYIYSTEDAFRALMLLDDALFWEVFFRDLDGYNKLRTLDYFNVYAYDVYSSPTKITSQIRYATSLKQFSANHLQLTKVPKELAELSLLESLDLADNALSVLPDDLRGLKNINTLILDANAFTQLPDFILAWPKLSHLYVVDNPLKKFPLKLLEKPDIEMIILTVKQVLLIPEALRERHQEVLHIVLSNNEGEFSYYDKNDSYMSFVPERLEAIKNVPVDFLAACFPHLDTISCNNCDLKILPDALNAFQKVTEIELKENKFEQFPPVFEQFPNLEKLDLSGNLITKIPDAIIQKWPVDIKINLKDNPIKEISEALFERIKNVQLDWNEASEKNKIRYARYLIDEDIQGAFDFVVENRLPLSLFKKTRLAGYTKKQLGFFIEKERVEWVLELIVRLELNIADYFDIKILGAMYPKYHWSHIRVETVLKYVEANTKITLRDLGLTVFPKEVLFFAKYITDLDLSNNKLSDFPNRRKFSVLKKLNLSNNQFDRFVWVDWDYKRLVKRITLATKNYYNLPPLLEELNLSHNQLEYMVFDEEILRLKGLNISHNKLNRMVSFHHDIWTPNSILPIEAYCLEKINLSHNQIRWIPPVFRILPQLIHLDLQHNQLKSFPYTPRTSKKRGTNSKKMLSDDYKNVNLEILKLEGNPIAGLPLDLLDTPLLEQNPMDELFVRCLKAECLGGILNYIQKKNNAF